MRPICLIHQIFKSRKYAGLNERFNTKGESESAVLRGKKGVVSRYVI